MTYWQNFNKDFIGSFYENLTSICAIKKNLYTFAFQKLRKKAKIKVVLE